MKTISVSVAYCFFIISGIFGLCLNLSFARGTPTATITPTPTVTATTTASATPTPQPPTVTTGDATYWGGAEDGYCSVTLNGTVNANGLLTTAWFEYGKTSGSYGSTTATQTISGTSDTAISSEIEVPSTDACNIETYYYRIVAQNNAGISYGNENPFSNCLYPIVDCFYCDVFGYITDATTGKGIENATILIDGEKVTATDDEGYYAFEYSDGHYDTCGNLEVEVLADGYLSSIGSGVADDECSCSMTLNFELQTIKSIKCSESSIATNRNNATLTRKKSVRVTVTVTGDDGLSCNGKTVTVKINSAGKKRVSVLPTSTVTDTNGEATFTITAKNKTGNARVTFRAGSVKKTMIVKVRG